MKRIERVIFKNHIEQMGHGPSIVNPNLSPKTIEKIKHFDILRDELFSVFRNKFSPLLDKYSTGETIDPNGRFKYQRAYNRMFRAFYSRTYSQKVREIRHLISIWKP
jgi:hypothetical protein